ncbi:MAG TPA: tRNA pseudouridine(38-40) synthase TruA [Clostridiales bacterium]|jgi:tRNA pseudouridine38-40 synthase|nr:tRNA pseudouridine(38-40) synthase TruA [Clostridiales bacterium]HOJ35664.1 tRNA pseudouridine(38-40) synthase TruA [Clostridiales bacterium]HOL79279.1 tRNA pseudouridine(38-40) synthase TruA [Clostridiales bacterium]HQA05593.1 tRNA pseudouridine(38-40) synthase TruA [Clostridiales bacterium]HQD72869.1 tRNA pseudouridine(38-40) synthase TruA [Clostridiales bacterium]
MRNLLLTLSFDGTEFHGWQTQKNAVTVQEVLGDAIFKACGERVTLHGCGRTDAKVHANMFCANFKTESKLSTDSFVSALNYYLPYSIAVKSCEEVDDSFHARFSCKSKEYVYLIWNARHRNPFYKDRAYHYTYPIDVDKMNKAAESAVGTHDFTSFCASGSEVEDKVRTIFSAKVERDADFVRFTVSGDGFLYNMVRIMVGSLLDIQNGKIEAKTLGEIIEAKDRLKAGFTAPAHGLYLNRVEY